MADPVFSLSGMQQSTDWNVDPKTQTVAGQLNSVIASDSPIMQQARARAMQTMNSRGLSNTSMAVGAADSAVYDKALQIATPDAATFADAAKTNAGTKNQFNLQNNAITAQTNAQNWGAAQDFGRQTQRDATLQGYNMQTLTAQQQNELARMNTQQGFNMQTLTAQQQNELSRMAASQGYNMQTLTAQQANDLQKMQLSQQNNLQTLSTQYGFDMAKMDKQAATTLGQMAVEQQNALAKLAANQGYTLEQLAKQSGYDIEKMKVQAAAAMDVADIEAVYKNITQGSQSATAVLNKMQDSLNALAANKDITDATKRSAMEADIKANAAEALNLIGAMATDLDLSSYISSIGL